jgi:hypothetical protein
VLPSKIEKEAREPSPCFPQRPLFRKKWFFLVYKGNSIIVRQLSVLFLPLNFR